MTSITSTTLPPVADRPAAAPAGWKPANVTPVQSVRSPGMISAAADAWRGRNELGNGTPLSQVQVSALAPFLASAFRLPEPAVTSDLQQVRLYVGGPAAKMSNMAVTIGRDIYVQGDSELQRITDWSHRRWLAHELGHTMQWRSVPDGKPPRSDVSRTRHTVGGYVGGMLVNDRFRPGAVPRGIKYWFNENWNPFNKNKTHIALGDAVHDRHHLEIQAEQHAREFTAANP